MNLEIVVRSAIDFNPLLVSVGINDIYGTRIALLHTDISGCPLPLHQGLQSFVCQVRHLPLSPGSYWLDVKLVGQGAAIIMASQCTSFLVENGDFHGTGRLPEREWGGVVQLAQKWQQHT